MFFIRRVSKLSSGVSFIPARAWSITIAMDAKEKMRRDDANASAIAEKLLQGWTMLAEYCPVDGCTTPLMRSRENKVFCVAHDMFVMSAEEAEAMKREGRGVDGTPVSTATTARKQEAYVEPEPPSVESLDDDFYIKLRTGSNGASNPASNPAGGVSAKIEKANSTALGTQKGFTAVEPSAIIADVAQRVLEPSILQTLRATSCTLAEKMEQTRAVLAKKSIADDDRKIDEAARLVSLLDALAATLAKLDAIGSKS